MHPDIEFLKEEEKEKMQQPNTASCASHNGSEWIVGVGLVLFGGLVLLSRFAGLTFRLWPIIILVIGMMVLFDGFNYFVKGNGRFSHRVSKGFVWGGIISVVGVALLFGWSIGAIWPVFLIIAGVAAILTGLLS